MRLLVLLIIITAFGINSYELKRKNFTTSYYIVELESFNNVFNVTVNSLSQLNKAGALSDMIRNKVFRVVRIMRFSNIDFKKIEKFLVNSFTSSIRAG